MVLEAELRLNWVLETAVICWQRGAEMGSNASVWALSLSGWREKGRDFEPPMGGKQLKGLEELVIRQYTLAKTDV